MCFIHMDVPAGLILRGIIYLMEAERVKSLLVIAVLSGTISQMYRNIFDISELRKLHFHDGRGLKRQVMFLKKNVPVYHMPAKYVKGEKHLDSSCLPSICGHQRCGGYN